MSFPAFAAGAAGAAGFGCWAASGSAQIASNAADARVRFNIVHLRDSCKDIPLYQAETNFSSGEIYAAGPWFATEFRCTFRRRRTGEQVDARGAIFCETKDGKISEMRMYWHRYAGGKEEPKA